MKLYAMIFVIGMVTSFTSSLSLEEFSKLQEGDQWTALQWADTLTNPYDTSKDKIVSKGKKLYMNMCKECHRKNGEGDGASMMYYSAEMRDLKSKAVQQQSDGALFWKITQGKSPMDPYKSKTTKKQRWQLVTFIRTLANEGSN